MEKQYYKQCFSMLILVSLISKYITPTNPSELPPLSPEYFSHAPEIEPPAPQIAQDGYLSPQYPSPPAFSPDSALDDYPSPPAYAADVAFSPESELDDYLPPQYPSPPPPPPPSTNDELLPAVEAFAPAPAMAASADEEDAVSTVVPEDSSGEDEEVSEYDEHEQGSGGSGGKRNGGAVVGVIIGLCIVGLAGFVLKKKKDHKMRRTQYEYLAKRDEL